jgi:UDP-N-acetylmuramate dehydrogenase
MPDQKISLKPFNTFGIDVSCREFIIIDSPDTLIAYIDQNVNRDPHQYMVLGGGSNMLLTENIDKTILYNQIKGVKIESTLGNHTVISAGGGENWHDLVMWCLNNDLGGIENLSLIPGSAGAAPIQNIGAYGVELKDVFYKLEAFHLGSGEIKIFPSESCHFGYRNSIFKTALKGEYLISKIYLKLTNAQHKLNTSYGAIQQELNNRGVVEPDIRDISDAVIHIRRSKLPDPKYLGNSGSFFKNPVVDLSVVESLKENFSDIAYFPFGEQYKLAAGWLIEKAGWKGKRVGETGCYKDQALVLVNYGNATGKEIFEHAQRIMDSVRKKFGVSLEMEVNIYP